MRHVMPYDYQFPTYTKGRWIGREILEVFSAEFQAYTKEYYEKAITEGRITVGGGKVSCEYRLKNGDHIVHTTVRREPPVDGAPIEVISMTDDLVVVNKPSSIPAHPCGAYRYNSLPFILAKENNLCDLHTMHRLDRLTSGVVILARTKAASEEFTKQMTACELQKEYLARVKGDFPAEGAECHGPIACKNIKVGVYAVDDKDPKAKEASTFFELLHRLKDGTSVVKCRPKTGRTHQIRVHLMHLGFPIANDGCYGGDQNFPGTRTLPHDDEQPCEQVPRDTVEAAGNSTTVAEGSAPAATKDSPAKQAPGKEDGAHAWQERAHAMEIWLHAHRYKSPSWEHVAELPQWALPK